MEIERTSIAGTVDTRGLSEEAVVWAEGERRLSSQTLGALGVKSGTAFFPDLNRKSRALFWPFEKGWKARSFPEKSFVAGGGFKAAFFNIEAVLREKPQTVWITEGELDAAALVEIGIPHYSVLSVPTGARERKPGTPLNPETYAYVDDALKAGLSQTTKFVWCGDNDTPGLQLREDMASMLGAARLCFIDWPKEVKDANQCLIDHGGKALRELLRKNQRPWPVYGLFKLSELPEPPPLFTWDVGGAFESWNDKIKFAPKTMSVVTGYPGHGKTQLFQQLWYQIARKHEITLAMASFETMPKPHLRRQIRGLYHNKREYYLTDEERAEADNWINDHYLFLYHPESQQSMQWFLDTAEVAVVRHGAKVIQLDPWNRLEDSSAPTETETKYILRCLKEAYSFAKDMGVHVQIVAHPAKVDYRKRDEPPTLQDISGSAHWNNVVDQGFAIHRPQIFDGTTRKTECSLYHLKARYEELGHPCKVDLDYNLDLAQYVSRDTSDVE